MEAASALLRTRFFVSSVPDEMKKVKKKRAEPTCVL
jgi:hypothetical protein